MQIRHAYSFDAVKQIYFLKKCRQNYIFPVYDVNLKHQLRILRNKKFPVNTGNILIAQIVPYKSIN